MALVLHTHHQRPCARSTILATPSLDVRPLCAREYEQTFRFADAAPSPRGQACPWAGHADWPPLRGHEAGDQVTTRGAPPKATGLVRGWERGRKGWRDAHAGIGRHDSAPLPLPGDGCRAPGRGRWGPERPLWLFVGLIPPMRCPHCRRHFRLPSDLKVPR